MSGLVAVAPLVLALAQLSAGPAGPNEPMAFTPSEIGPRYVDIDAVGTIVEDSPERLAAYLRQLESRGLIDGKVSIAFDSGGGNLDAALEMGRLIRKWNISTTVKYGGLCLSACSYAFLGGVVRYLPVDADEIPSGPQEMLGFHRFYNPLDAIAAEENDVSGRTQMDQSQQSQITARRLLEYLSEMGVDSATLRYASSAPPDDMYFPRIEQLKEANILSFRGETDLRLVADDGNVFATVSRVGWAYFDQLTIGCSPGPRRRPFLTMTTSRQQTRAQGRTSLPLSPVWKLPKLPARPTAGESGRSRIAYAFGDASAAQFVTGAFIDLGGRREALPAIALDVRADPEFWHFTLFPSRAFLAGFPSSAHLSVSIDGAAEAGEHDRAFFLRLDTGRAGSLLAVLKPCLG